MKPGKTKAHFFTLLEVLVSMGVFTILMLALMQFFSAAQTVWEKSGNRTEMYESARLAIQMLQQDLATAYYGDVDCDMDKFRFFQYKVDSSKKITHLTFAAEDSNGLTATNYCWFDGDNTDSPCTFAVAKKQEAEVEVDDTKWVTRNSGTYEEPASWNNSDNWITDIQKKSPDTLIENVLSFHVYAKYFGEENFSTLDENEDKRPPDLMYITLSVISEDALERIGRLSSKTDKKDILKQAREVFKNVFNEENGALKSNALDDEDAQKRTVFEGTQFFNIMISIERYKGGN